MEQYRSDKKEAGLLVRLHEDMFIEMVCVARKKRTKIKNQNT